MQRIRILSLFLFVSLQGISQTNLESSMILGGNAADEAKDLAINPTGTAFFFGARTSSSDGNVPGNAGGSDFWIIKTDVDGTILWNKTFGGVGNDELQTVLPHTDGGVLAFGTTRTDHGLFGDLQGLAGGWLIRTNNSGTLVDGKIFGGNITELAVDAVRHASGNVTMAMESGSPILNGQSNNGLLDVWIVNVNANLATQWTSLLGGSDTDVPNAMITDMNSNNYVVATSESNLPGLDPNKGKKDIWIIKISPTGQTLWQKSFGGSEDDLATDIIFHPDGFLYVFAHSLSDDGDFDSNSGVNDIWMIKLDAANGDLYGKYRFGGSSNDINAHGDLFGTNQIIITATSTSSNGDLSGNKGFGDVWIFATDTEGVIQQQMNYGGSLNDLAVDVVVHDSIFHFLSSTLSTDKNVPFNSFSQQDLWYFTLNPYPDSCSSQFLCLPDSMLTNHLFPPANDALICISGCNAGYGAGPIFPTGTCADFINSTAYFFLTTDTMADLLTLSVRSEEFNKPQIALLKSVNCVSFQQVACASGENGDVILPYIAIDENSNYVIAISDSEGNIGEFELCATSVDVEFCNEKDRIFATSTSMNSPLAGPYKPGEEVQICYELEDWNKLECNGFQGLVPSFGPGWDASSFDMFGKPLQIDSMLSPVTTGFWQWYQVGEVFYNVSNPINGYDGGQGMPAGWYFTNTADPPPAFEPDQTTGDINSCLPTSDKWKICFTLQVVDECDANIDCSIGMKTFSDGELGINSSLACAYDSEEIMTANMVCCLNPAMQVIQDFSVCSGDTISFKPGTNLLPPFTYTWTADPDPFISGAASGTELSQFYQVLTTSAVIPLTVRYSIFAEGEGCETEEEDFTVTVIPRPTSRITIAGPNIICSGSTVTFNFENTGAPPFAIGLFRENEFFANILSETNFISIDIDPVFSGRFRIGTLRDASCDGQGIGFVNVTVKPVKTTFIDTTICDGESFIIGLEEFSETGTYTVTLDNGAENNCDSTIILDLVIAPTLTESINETICNGDTLYVLGEPYTETTNTLIEYTGPEGCPAYIDLQLLVKDTFTMDIEQTICNGDTLEFGGIQIYQPGTYSFVEEVQPGCFEETVLELSVLPAIVINDLAIIEDNGSNTGAILVEIKGGSPPFDYEWSTGQTTESLFNIMHGEYQLTVTDRVGCMQSFSFEVPFISGTNENAATDLKIALWPTIAASGEKIQLIHSGSDNISISSLDWWSMQGHSISMPLHVEIASGSRALVAVPDALPAGIYLVRISLESGDLVWSRMVVQE